MSSLRSFIRVLAIASACAFITAPIAANAGEKPNASRTEKGGKRHHDKAEFPMDPAKFDAVVERKIEHARTKMEQIMSANSLPDSVKTQIRKEFDAAAAKVRTSAKEAGKDGKVTKEEAKDVRQQARGFVKDLKQKYGKGDQDKHAKGRGKHHGKRDGKRDGKHHGKRA